MHAYATGLTHTASVQYNSQQVADLLQDFVSHTVTNRKILWEAQKQ